VYIYKLFSIIPRPNGRVHYQTSGLLNMFLLYLKHNNIQVKIYYVQLVY